MNCEEYRKRLKLNYTNKEKLRVLKELYSMDVEEIVELNILDDVFELLTTTKERGFEDIISTQYSSDSKNKVIIILSSSIL